MLACFLFFLGSWAAVPLIDGLNSPQDALRVFEAQVVVFFTTLRLIPGAPGGLGLFLAQSLLFILLWATLGLSIARCIALRLCRDEYLGLKEALAFGLSNARTTALFPLIVFAAVSFLAAGNFLLGSLMQIPYLGALFLLLLPVCFVQTTLMLIIVGTSLLGAGMVSGAVAVEQRGTLDAWGKALNYIFARPLHVIIYMVLMKVFLVDIILGVAYRSTMLESWTFTSLVPLWDNQGFQAILSGRADLEGFDAIASWLVRFVVSCVKLGIAGLVTSFAFAGTTAMFLILRRDVDGIDVSDIKQEGD